MSQSTERYTVSRPDVARMSERVEHFLTEQGLERREIERMRLTLEMLLRRISEQLGWETRCELALGRHMGRARIELRYRGAAFDPTLIGRESEGDAWSAQLLAEVGLVPVWSWRRGVNRLVLEPPARARSVWPATFAAIALAAGLRFVLPGEWMETLAGAALSPLLDGYSGVLGVLAPLILFLSATGIVCGAGDTLAHGRGARVMMGRFLTRTVVWTALGTAAMALLCFPPAFARGAKAAVLFREIAPRDLRWALFFGLLAGAAAHALGGRAERVREWAEQCRAVCVRAAEYVLVLLPLAVFASAARLISNGSLAALAALWKPLAAFAACALAILLVKLAAVSVKRRQSVAALLRALWPAFCTALSAASSAAAFGRMMDNCENELDVPHDLVLVGLSVGDVLCAPIAALCYPAVALCAAEGSGASLGAAGLVMLAVMSAAFAVALPSLHGAPLLCALSLPALLGLPGDGATAAVLLIAVLDPLSTACSGAYLQLELAAQAEIEA